MSLVNILNVQILDNPSTFSQPFQFEITFECLSSLEQDLEWKIVYVGSAESDKHDQVLDSIMVGPVPVGINKFVFQADAPNPALIPAEELRGVTVVLLICAYMDQEFIRIGYYVDTDFEDEALRENPPSDILASGLLGALKRNILADKPRVTRFNIKWDPNQEEDLTELLNAKVDENGHDEWTEDEQEDEEDEEEEEEDDEESDSDAASDPMELATSAMPSEADLMDVEPVC